MKTKPKRRRVHGGSLHARAYDVMCRAVEDGVEFGWNRAHDNGNSPNEHEIRGAIEEAIMDQIIDWFDFGTPKHSGKE